MNKKIVVLLQVLIGILLLAFLFWKVGIKDFISVLKKVNVHLLLITLLILIASHLMGTLKISTLLKAIGQKLPFLYLFRATTLSFSLGFIAPGKMGEFSILLFLRNKNISYGKGLAAILIDKVLTFLIVSLFALIGLLFYLDFRYFFLVLGIILALFSLLVYAIVSKNLRYLVKKYILRKYAKHFKGFSNTCLILITKGKKGILLNIMFSLFKFMLMCLSIWVLFRALGFSVFFPFVIFINSIIIILTLIPITFSGLGLREVSGTYLYQLVTGVGLAVTLNVVLISTVLRYFTGFVFYLANVNLINEFYRSKHKSPK